MQQRRAVDGRGGDREAGTLGHSSQKLSALHGQCPCGVGVADAAVGAASRSSLTRDDAQPTWRDPRERHARVRRLLAKRNQSMPAD